MSKQEYKTAPARPPVQPPPPAGAGGQAFQSLFIPAGKIKSRIKVLLWGKHGTHKTRTALSFPRPAVIDVEGLAQVYSRDYPDAAFFPAHDLESVKAGIQAVIADGGRSCETLVIDSLTPVYDGRKAYWFAKRGYLGQVERERINIEMKSIYALLAAVPVNVVLIYREADLYEDDSAPQSSGGNSNEPRRPKKIGVRMDADKSAAYTPNFVIHMTGAGGGIVEKVQGLPLEAGTPITDASWGGFFADIAELLANGDDPDDIRDGVGKALFMAYWKGRGLTSGQVAAALGVKAASEWTKGRAAADQQVERFALEKGWLSLPEPGAESVEPNEPGEPEPDQPPATRSPFS